MSPEKESLEAVNKIVELLEPLDDENRARVIMAVCILLGIIVSDPKI